MIRNFQRKLSGLRRNLSRRHLLAALAALMLSGGGSQAQKKGGPEMPRKKERGRVEPLFRSREDAHDIITTYCMGKVDEPLTPTQRDMLLFRLLPQMWLAPSDRASETLGGTRFGGAPDMPKSSTWPTRPTEIERSKAAAEGRFPNAWIVRQLAETVPFEFIGQIDLTEATHFKKHAQNLPPTGRVQFFLDVAMLMHEPAGGSHACKVIYDTSSVDGLERLAIPAKFDEMEAWWRAPDPSQIVHFQKMLLSLEAAGQKAAANAMRNMIRKSETPDPKSRKPFVHPLRAKRVEPLMVLPGRTTLEYVLDRELKAFTSNDPGEEHYLLLTSNDMSPFNAGSPGKYQRQPWALREARNQRLMGPPQPEQDDPRYEAVPKSELPPYPWNDAQLHEASLKAAAWQMLLQVSMADLSQQQGEGMVYFLVHKDDLAKLDFTRVTVVYQQT